MTAILMRKRLGSLAPEDDAAIQSLKRVKEGSILTVDIALRDNGTDQQRKYAFALLGIMFESQTAFEDFEKFRQYMLIRLGHCDVFQSPDGPVAVPHSMKRGALDKAEWIQLIEDIINYAVNVMGFERESLEAEGRERAA